MKRLVIIVHQAKTPQNEKPFIMQDVKKIATFVLSLEHRRDRQESAARQLVQAKVNYDFILSKQNEDFKKYKATAKITQIELSIWGSHVRALKAFLETSADWALIFEDDFSLTTQGVELLQSGELLNTVLPAIGDKYSMLQIGFLGNSKKTGLEKILASLFRFLFRFNRFDFRSFLKHISHVGLKNHRIMKRDLKKARLGKTTILHGLRLGTHAYLINRQAACTLIECFDQRESTPDFMTIDQYLLRLTLKSDSASILRAARFSHSFVSQSGSPSDNTNMTHVQALDI